MSGSVAPQNPNRPTSVRVADKGEAPSITFIHPEFGELVVRLGVGGGLVRAGINVYRLDIILAREEEAHRRARQDRKQAFYQARAEAVINALHGNKPTNDDEAALQAERAEEDLRELEELEELKNKIESLVAILFRMSHLNQISTEFDDTARKLGVDGILGDDYLMVSHSTGQ